MKLYVLNVTRMIAMVAMVVVNVLVIVSSFASADFVEGMIIVVVDGRRASGSKIATVRNVGRRGICRRDCRLWWWRWGGALQHMYRCRRNVEQGFEERRRLEKEILLIGAVFVVEIAIVVVEVGCATTRQQIAGGTEIYNLIVTQTRKYL